MKIREITTYIEELAPLKFQEDYDNAGLISGDPDDEVKGILLCLDLTDEVLDEAISKNCNLIISHHPFVFKAVKNITSKTLTGRLMIKAIRNHIHIYAVHTNLDQVEQGVNQILGQKLRLMNLRILRPFTNTLYKLVVYCPNMRDKDDIPVPEKVRNALFKAGAGQIGNYDSCSYNTEGYGTFRGLQGSQPFIGEQGKMESQNEIRIETIFPAHLKSKVVEAMLAVHPYEEVAYDIYKLENEYPKAGAGMTGTLEYPLNGLDFLYHVKSDLGLQMLRHNQIPLHNIHKVAFCGGSGAFLIPDAIQQGCDAFVSADLKYHEFLDTNGELLLVDIGHYEGEQFTIELLYDYLIKKYDTFAVSKTMVKTNPINYF